MTAKGSAPSTVPSKKAYGSFPFRVARHLQELLRQNGGDEQAVAAFGDDGLEQRPIGRLVVAIELVDQQLGPVRFEIRSARRMPARQSPQ